MRSYYVPRWELFVSYSLNSTTSVDGENAGLARAVEAFEQAWQLQVWGQAQGESYTVPDPSEFPRVMARVVGEWGGVFGL